MAIINLNELNTREMMGIIGKIAMPIKAIMNDAVIRTEYDRLKKDAVKRNKDKDKAAESLGIAILIDIVPMVISSHMDNVAKIYGALTNKTVDEVYEQPAALTFKEIGQILKDGEFMGFFQSLSK